MRADEPRLAPPGLYLNRTPILALSGDRPNAAADAPAMDLIVTVCDNAAGEVCPIWPGHPVTAHWGLPDPAAAEGSLDDKRAAFDDAFQTLERRIHMLVSLPLDTLDSETLKRRIQDIGRLSVTGRAAP